MDKIQAKRIVEEIEAALRPVAARNGMSVKVRGCTYDPSGSLKPRVIFETSDLRAVEFKRYCEMYDLVPDDFARTFRADNGKVFTIAGLRMGSRTRPVIATDDQGREFVFKAAAVVRALGRKPALTRESL